MFDLVVGTSTGGIIAPALAMSNSTLPDMVTFFTNVSQETFSQTTAGWISRFGPLKKVTTYSLAGSSVAESVFSADSLESGLKSFFKPNDTSLFRAGPARASLLHTRRCHLGKGLRANRMSHHQL